LLSEITLLFDLSLDLDRTLAQRKAEQKAKSKVKVTQSVGICVKIKCRWLSCEFFTIKTKLWCLSHRL